MIAKDIFELGLSGPTAMSVITSSDTDSLDNHFLDLKNKIIRIRELLVSQTGQQNTERNSKVQPDPIASKRTSTRKSLHGLYKGPKVLKRLCGVHRYEWAGTFGKMFICSKTFDTSFRYLNDSHPTLEGNSYKIQTKIIVHPSPWVARYLTNYGIHLTIEKSFLGYRAQFSMPRAVSDDALIFDFCRAGYIEGIQTLLVRGEASPLDTNSDGFTPLHVRHFEHAAASIIYIW
jgi:hypothetical protein